MSKSQGRPGDEGDLEGAGSALDPELEQLAKRMMGAKDERARVLAPLSAGEREAMAERMLGSGGRGLVQKRREIWSWAALLAAVLGALVVVGVAWWGRGIRDTGDPIAFTVELFSGDDQRLSSNQDAPSDAPIRLRPTTRLEISLSHQGGVWRQLPEMVVVQNKVARRVAPAMITDGSMLKIDQLALDALGPMENGPAELVIGASTSASLMEKLKEIALLPIDEIPRGISIYRAAVLFEGWEHARIIDPADLELQGCDAYAIETMPDGQPRFWCEVSETTKKLVLWAPVPKVDQATLRLDKQSLQGETLKESEGGGTRWGITLNKDTRRITLTSGYLAKGVQHFYLRSLSTTPELDEATKLKNENKLNDAEKKLNELQNPQGLLKIAVLRLRARIEQRRGNRDKATQLLQEAAEQSEALGRISDALEDRLYLAYKATNDRLWDEARRHFEGLVEDERTWPGYRSDEDYYRGILAMELGRYREAEYLLEGALKRALRLEFTVLESRVLQSLAEIKGIVGRDGDAIQDLARVIELQKKDDEGPCEQALAQTNLSWAYYRQNRFPERALESAEKAMRILGDQVCGSTWGTAAVNLVFAQIGNKRLQEARRGISDLKKEEQNQKLDQRLWPWIAAAELELALKEAPSAALARAEALETQDPHIELSFEAALTKARAYEALGDRKNAEASYERAIERWLDWGKTLSKEGSHISFFAHRRRVFQHYLGFIVDGPDSESSKARQAAALIHHTLVRLPSALLLEYPGGGTKPVGGEGASPEELTLYYHPLPKGWLGLAFNNVQGGILYRFTGDGLPKENELITPFADLIRGAKRIRVIADQALEKVSFEYLSLDGKRLLDHALLSYGAAVKIGDIGPTDPRKECQDSPNMLVVSNPSGKSAGADKLSDKMKRWAGHERVRYLVREEATKQNVLEALSDTCIEVFHYHGHANFGGVAGFRAGLELWDGRLTVQEILNPEVLARVPEVAVLMGCEAGKEDGMGIARAFLARGSRRVLAPTQVVEDGLATELVPRLYRETFPASGQNWDLDTALRDAVRGLLSEGKRREEMEAFRLFSR